MKLTIYGPSFGGKTSVIKRFLTNKFETNYGKTIGAQLSKEVIKIKEEESDLLFWDIAGGKEFRFLLPSFMKGSAGLLLIFDLTNNEHYSEVESYLNFAKKYVGPDIPLLIVGNKKDKLTRDDSFAEKRKAMEKFAKAEKGDYFEISAKTGENIEKMIRNITYKVAINKKERENLAPNDIKFKIITEELIIKVYDLLFEANNLLTQNEFEQVEIIINQAEGFALKYQLEKGLHRVNDLKKRLEDKLNLNKKMLIQNKIKIHRLIHSGDLNRCPLHEEINTECMKIEKIRAFIEEPNIFGFFMYQFPKQQEEYYQAEITKIKELITHTNVDPFIHIKLPTESTGLDIKTCDFCKFARSFDFGILLLNPVNPNADLEAGMFLSYGKRVVLLNNESRSGTSPFDLSPYFFIQYRDLTELEDNWYGKMPQYIQNIKRYYLTELSN